MKKSGPISIYSTKAVNVGMFQEPPRVRPICGLLGSEPGILLQARAELSGYFGIEALATEPAAFNHTAYYAAEMGPEILRQYLVFKELRDPGELPDWKQATALLERRWADPGSGRRRVNLDPGYLAPGKLILASTKDHAHRIYLRNGIFAEVTLRFRDGHFSPWEWSYPDYIQARDFFERAYRAYLYDLRSDTPLGESAGIIPARHSERGFA